MDASPRCPCLWWNVYAEPNCSFFEVFYGTVLGGLRSWWGSRPSVLGVFTCCRVGCHWSGSDRWVHGMARMALSCLGSPIVPCRGTPVSSSSLLRGSRFPTGSRCPASQYQAGAWSERLLEKHFLKHAVPFRLVFGLNAQGPLPGPRSSLTISMGLPSHCTFDSVSPWVHP